MNLERSTGNDFDRSPGGVRNTPRPSYLAAAISIWPYQGFGNDFDASSQIRPLLQAGYGYTYGSSFGDIYANDSDQMVGYDIYLAPYNDAFVFDASDVSNTYQKITYLVTWSNGSTRQIVSEYFNYWINGFGYRTVTFTTTNTGAVPGPPFGAPYEFGILTRSDSVSSLSATTTLTLCDTSGSAPAGTEVASCTISVTLANQVLYSDVAAASLTGLTSLTPPPAPSGANRFDFIWPDTATTTQTVTNAGTIFYGICAANGVYVEQATGLIHGGSISFDTVIGDFVSPPYYFGLPAGSIICAKTQWTFGDIYELNNRPINATTFVPEPMVPLAYLVPNVGIGSVQVFSPEALTELSHTGSDVPPYGFTPPYAPPYTPPPIAYGEIGIGRSIQ